MPQRVGIGCAGEEGDVAALHWSEELLMSCSRGKGILSPMGAFPGEFACAATRRLGRSGGVAVPSDARTARLGLLTSAQRRKKVRGEG
jgi:hypothetical protein